MLLFTELICTKYDSPSMSNVTGCPGFAHPAVDSPVRWSRRVREASPGPPRRRPRRSWTWKMTSQEQSWRQLAALARKGRRGDDARRSPRGREPLLIRLVHRCKRPCRVGKVLCFELAQPPLRRTRSRKRGQVVAKHAAQAAYGKRAPLAGPARDGRACACRRSHPAIILRVPAMWSGLASKTS